MAIDEFIGKKSSEPFIGMLTKEGKLESYPESYALKNDYHHQFIIKDEKSYNLDSTLRFVKNKGDNAYTINGDVALNPNGIVERNQISKWARAMIDQGADPNTKIKIADLKMSPKDAPFQGKIIGSLADEVKLPQTPPEVIETAYKSTVANGGVTINLAGKQPKTGYAYSPFKGLEVQIPKSDFVPDNIENFANSNFGKLNEAGNHLGIWEENGKIFIDISKVGPPTAKTIKEAELNGQLAVFDLKNFETIYTELGKKSKSIK